MSKENFKLFAKNHPELANNVILGKVTWQKLYELYDIYGENSSVWNDFLNSNVETINQTSFKDIFNVFRNLDMESVQKGVNNIQKTIGLLQELGIGTSQKQSTYEPRPIYRRFED